MTEDSINGIAETSTTSLISAVLSNKDVSAIELLLKNNADVNICNEYRETPLHLSIRLEIAKLLIKFGADVNSIDVHGNTPLMTALTVRSCDDIILELIKSGTHIDIHNTSGQSALHLALDTNRNENIINEICHGCDDFNKRDVYGLSPLCYALRSRYKCYKTYQLYFIKQLIHKGFIVDKCVIWYAIGNCKDLDTVKEIIKYHDVRSVIGRNNRSVLHVVGDPRITGILVRNGAQINHKCNDGVTPLQWHLTYNLYHTSSEIIESLLFWGADIRDVDKIFNEGDKVAGNCSEIKFSDLIYDVLILYGFSVDINNSIIKLLLKQILLRKFDLFNTSSSLNYGLLRHILVSNQNVFIQNDLLNSSKIIDFFQSHYYPELEKMERNKITPNLSYRKFCLKEFRSIKRNYFPEFTEKDHRYIKSFFPYFFNEIIIKIRIHINIHKRKKLKKYLLKIRLITKNCIEKDDENPGFERDEFDRDCLSMVGNYLNDREISSLIAASVM